MSDVLPPASWAVLAISGSGLILWFLRPYLQPKPGPETGPDPVEAHLLKRLQALMARAEMERFDETRVWIARTYGPELLDWMHSKAQAEGDEALARRLARG